MISTWMLVVLAEVILFPICLIEAAISCNSDDECVSLLQWNESRCEGGICSNPFQRGCLHTFNASELVRVCNSDDYASDEKGSKILKNRNLTGDDSEDDVYCIIAEFENVYPKLRVHHGGWVTSIFLAWIYQILAMEILRLPITVGLTTEDTHLASFYSPNNTMEDSPILYPLEGIALANELADERDNCESTIEPCVHVIPEVWSGISDKIELLEREKVIDVSQGNGVLGKYSMYIPAFTAQALPTLTSFYGYQGEQNRQLLAQTFKRPTKWIDYCLEVSTSNCSGDEFAKRYPKPDEEDRYFSADGDYIGYFRYTDKNDCVKFPSTCSGHIVAPPCSWSAWTDAKLFHNGIVGLESDGPNTLNGGYFSASDMTDVWKAANATKSHVMMVWYTPEAVQVSFIGYDAEFIPVAFPGPTPKCLRNRVSQEDRCEFTIEKRRGVPEGSCDEETQQLRKVIAMSVYDSSTEAVNVWSSPASDFFRYISIPNEDMIGIMERWLSIGVDTYGNDARQAVCEYVNTHIDRLVRFIPNGYPKTTIFRSDFHAWYAYFAWGTAVCVGVTSLTCMLLVVKYRRSKAIFLAQPFFIHLILTGFLFASMGAVLTTLEPTPSICVSREWFITLGSTVELVPLLVKTLAINRLMNSSKKSKVVTLNRNLMFVQVTLVVFGVVLFLLAWTTADTPSPEEVRSLMSEDDSVISVDLTCQSRTNLWGGAALCWEVFLLFLTAILAFQSRKNSVDELNDSQQLGRMVYFHVMFVVGRGVLEVLQQAQYLPSSLGSSLRCLNYSFDAFCAMSIYVFPKLYEGYKAPNMLQSGRKSSTNVPSSKYIDEDEMNIRLLACTANIGNAEPTLESMETWIPPEGSCEHVEALYGGPLLPGAFDLIVVGMQESTWKPKNVKSSQRGLKKALVGFSTRFIETFEDEKVDDVNDDPEGSPPEKVGAVSEEQVLAALEDRETHLLREMIQEILGDRYSPVVEEMRGQMRLMVWVHDRVVDEITDIKVSGANTGIGNVLANKGGIVATFNYRSTRISFVSAHLAAHEGEGYYKSRCENIKSIFRDAKTFKLSKKLDVASSSHHTFFMGDLNFRTNFGTENQHEKNVQRALNLIEFKDYEGLYEFDELQKGIKDGDCFHDFRTLPCLFPPTFKVERKAGYEYKHQRVPSYTDRILYKSSDGLRNNLKALAYEACPDFATSDHKPIRGAFHIIPNAALDMIIPQHDIHFHFRKFRCADLPPSDATGKSDPYLMFLWDSIDLVPVNQSIMDQIRQFTKGVSWPRTRFISQNLNPVWQHDVVSLVARHAKIGADAMIFICVIDYDFVGKDDLLCVLPINVQGLVGGDLSKARKTVKVDRPLLRDGKIHGRIKFRVDMQLQPVGQASFGSLFSYEG